jgi:hypothetical protein
MAQITTHLTDAIRRLLEQYKDKTNISGLLTALMVDVQPEEDAVYQLLDRLNIDLMGGVNLDRIGVIVGQPRENRDDPAYRIRLKARIIQNISQGEPETLIRLVALLMTSPLVEICEECNGGVIIMAQGMVDPSEIDSFYENIQIATAAGVRFQYLGCFGSNPFSFDGPLTTAFTGSGFGTTTDLAIGGEFPQLCLPTLPKFAMDGADPKTAGFGTVLDPLIGGFFVGV